MAELSRFFNSSPDDIRKYNASEFAEFISTFYSTGIVSGGSQLQVTKSSSNLSVIVSAGKAVIEGYWYKNTAPLTLQVSAADNQHPRIDRVVLRLNLTSLVRSINLIILPGTPAALPKPPALARNDNYYDLSLAQLFIVANGLTVSAVTDERLNGDLCGITQGLYSVDLQEFDQKLQALLAEIQESGNQAISSITDMSNATLLQKVKEIDGSDSGIDSDLLDGQHGSYYLNYSNLSNKPAIPKITSGTSAPSGGTSGDIYIQY